jgi:hypothetical protein
VLLDAPTDCMEVEWKCVFAVTMSKHMLVPHSGQDSTKLPCVDCHLQTFVGWLTSSCTSGDGSESMGALERSKGMYGILLVMSYRLALHPVQTQEDVCWLPRSVTAELLIAVLGWSNLVKWALTPSL